MKRRYYSADIAVTAVIFLIGSAEAAHLYGVFLNQPLEKCMMLFGAALLSALLLLAVAAVYLRRREKKVLRVPWAGREAALLAVFLFLVLSQLYFIINSGKPVYRGGDMTPETVGSFLESGGIYRVNPMTGSPYEAGMPDRIKILCLPTLYAMLCSISGVSPAVMVWRMIPSVTLIFSYVVYLCLAKSLFPENRFRQLGFLTVTAILIWAGSYWRSMDGFSLLYSGWRGVTWRNTVLIPYTISLCLRKNYLHGLLCAAAEASIVWTLYGLGMCLPVIVVMALIMRLTAGRTPEKEVPE